MSRLQEIRRLPELLMSTQPVPSSQIPVTWIVDTSYDDWRQDYKAFMDSAARLKVVCGKDGCDGSMIWTAADKGYNYLCQRCDRETGWIKTQYD